MIDTSTRKLFVHTVEIEGTQDEVFPLLCPVREYEWIAGWQCKLIYSESGLIEKGCVFTTDFPGTGKEVWHVSEYTGNEHICFIRTSSDTSIRFDIDLYPKEGNTIDMRWAQMMTAVTDKGANIIHAISPESYAATVDKRGSQLEYFIRNGMMMIE